jgi:hypothetical protein
LIKVDLGARKTEKGEDYLGINSKGYCAGGSAR